MAESRLELRFDPKTSLTSGLKGERQNHSSSLAQSGLPRDPSFSHPLEDDVFCVYGLVPSQAECERASLEEVGQWEGKGNKMSESGGRTPLGRERPVGQTLLSGPLGGCQWAWGVPTDPGTHL